MEIGFWIFMLIMVLITPLAMIVFGREFKKSPPKEINSNFGYRTKRSMQNQDTWDFAHYYLGKLWIKLGIPILFLSVGAMFFSFGSGSIISVGGNPPSRYFFTKKDTLATQNPVKC